MCKYVKLKLWHERHDCLINMKIFGSLGLYQFIILFLLVGPLTWLHRNAVKHHLVTCTSVNCPLLWFLVSCLTYVT
jgi:hypothetical protein